MKVIKDNTYVYTPNKMRKKVQFFTSEDTVEGFDTDNNVTVNRDITKAGNGAGTGEVFTINDTLSCDRHLEFWTMRDSSWSWKKAHELLVGDYLFTARSRVVRIDKINIVHEVIEGSIITADNFFAGEYLVR